MKKVILGLILVSAITLAGCSQVNDEVTESSSVESSSSIQESTTESSAAARSTRLESSEESETDRIVRLLTEANEIYTAQLEVAKGFISNPDSRTPETRANLKSELTRAVDNINEVYALVGYEGEGIQDDGAKALFDDVENKVSEMTEVMSQFPSDNG